MVKKIWLFILVILISPFAFAIEEYEVGEDVQTELEQAQEEIKKERHIIEKLDAILAKLGTLPNKGSSEENFKQIDNRFQNFFNQQTAFFIGILVLNDLLIIAGFLLLRSKEII